MEEILHRERLYELQLSLIIARVIKLQMNWTRHVVHMGEKRGVYRVWSGNLKEKQTTWKN
jgi:hypothetical protein